MKITERLLGYLHRVFSRDPKRMLALRVRYDGTGMVMKVEDAVLTTTVTGGLGTSLTVDLRQHTFSTLADFIETQAGYSVEYENPQLGSVGAWALLDVVTDQAASNGDHLYAYTSPLRAFLEAFAEELTTARKQIPQLVRQMSVPTANDVWLDELGSYFKVPRLPGESDAVYGPRMIAEVIQPRNNNIAIEEAIRTATGVNARVTDAEMQEDVDVGGGVLADSYGLFDVLADIELADLEEGIQIDQYAVRVHELIEKFRAAGTHRRLLSTRTITRARMRMAAVTASGIFAKVFGEGEQLTEGAIYIGAGTQTFEISTVYPLE